MAAKSLSSPVQLAGAAGLAPDHAEAKVIKRFQCCWIGQFARTAGSRVSTDDSTAGSISRWGGSDLRQRSDDGSRTCVAAGGIAHIGPGAVVLLRR